MAFIHKVSHATLIFFVLLLLFFFFSFIWRIFSRICVNLSKKTATPSIQFQFHCLWQSSELLVFSFILWATSYTKGRNIVWLLISQQSVGSVDTFCNKRMRQRCREYMHKKEVHFMSAMRAHSVYMHFSDNTMNYIKMHSRDFFSSRFREQIVPVWLVWNWKQVFMRCI